MTNDRPARQRVREHHGPALSADGAEFGLRRRVVETSSSPVVVRAGAVTGDTAMIFLHGAAGSWTTWTPLLRAAQRSDHPLTDVIAIDLPGWGESPDPTPALDVERMSRAVCEIAQSLGYQRWIVVGHSLGGFLALDIAARTHTQAQAVLAISPSGPAVLAAIRHGVNGWLRLPAFAGMLLIMRVLAACGPIGLRFVRGLHRIGVLRLVAAPLFADPAAVDRTVVDALAQEVRPRAFVDAARAASAYDLTTWRAIACPVRAMRGDRDVFVSDSDRLGLEELIADFDQVTLPGAGHFAAVEKPETVLDALRALVATTTPRVGAS